MTTTTQSMTRPQELLEGWTRLWNGELDQARRICAGSFSIRFGGRVIGDTGDAVATPDELAELIGAFRSSRPGLTYAVVEAHTDDAHGYCVWNATMGDLHVGGIDTFTFTDGLISRVHSVTAERPMTS